MLKVKREKMRSITTSVTLQSTVII